ncbi:MAG: response regulator [Bacteroidales bacterium]
MIEPINLMLFSVNLKNQYNILTASSDKQAQQMLQTNNTIDIVISDMKMPEMNGIELITKTKKEFSNITFFILTGFEINDKIATILQTNIIEKYFHKPFDKKRNGDCV